MGRRKRPIDWDEVFKWLAMGYDAQDMAAMLGFNRTYFSQRAREELTPEQKGEWRHLIGYGNKGCGTRAGYCRHRRRKEKPCGPCQEAQSEYASWYYNTTGRYRRDERKQAAAQQKERNGRGSAGGGQGRPE